MGILKRKTIGLLSTKNLKQLAALEHRKRRRKRMGVISRQIGQTMSAWSKAHLESWVKDQRTSPTASSSEFTARYFHLQSKNVFTCLFQLAITFLFEFEYFYGINCSYWFEVVAFRQHSLSVKSLVNICVCSIKKLSTLFTALKVPHKRIETK